MNFEYAACPRISIGVTYPVSIIDAYLYEDGCRKKLSLSFSNFMSIMNS